MVYTPAVGTPGAQDYVAPKFEYVTWDPTLNNGDGGYKKSDITTVITDLINASETKTKIVTINNVQYYLSESFNKSTELAAATTDEEKFLVLFPTSGTPAIGVYKIDVVGGVVNNIEEIFTTETTIVINEGELNQQTFETVQEYIEYIISESNQPVGSMTFTQGTGTSTADKLASSSFTYILADGTVSPPITFSDLVKANETNTTLEKNNSTGSTDIIYTYKNENAIKNNVAGTDINITADILSSITNNTDVRNAIQNILNAGGSVYYTETEIAAADNNGTLVPAKTLYIIKNVNGNDVKTPIDISGTVITAITNNSETVKNILGDTYSTTTVVNTGDTWVDGGAIYKGIYETTVLKGTANITGGTATAVGEIAITAPTGTVLGDVISVKILDKATNSLITTSVTDVTFGTTGLKFRIGTGKMYNVLSTTADLEVKVLIEFSATPQP
nr:hypothetical protein [uncultured Flavobacterium sp.]